MVAHGRAALVLKQITIFGVELVDITYSSHPIGVITSVLVVSHQAERDFNLAT